MRQRIRAAVKRGLPDPLVHRIQHERSKRSHRPKPIDDSSLRLIREAALEDLRDAAWLEHELLPRLGLNDEELQEFPEALIPIAVRVCATGSTPTSSASTSSTWRTNPSARTWRSASGMAARS